MEYLDFITAKCKDCFKCLRECPVKAIRYENHQAVIIDDRCILCGKCTLVCPQHAKQVHSEKDKVIAMLSGGGEVVASVAPSFVSNFNLSDFSPMKSALIKLGFKDAEETAIGARVVTEDYAKLLASGKYKNLISSACPAINKMIQIYYPAALKYLAPTSSPMVVHAKMLKSRYPNAKIVFIGPCIAKKREAKESGIIDGVLNFEELSVMMKDKNITFESSVNQSVSALSEADKLARYYPVNSGIIKSFTQHNEKYEYITIDGVKRCFEALKDIENSENTFLEVNCCDHACVNGPCSMENNGGVIKADEITGKYVRNSKVEGVQQQCKEEVREQRTFLGNSSSVPGEKEITAVLNKTGKYKPEDELNCGACGYSTCREKAIAVINGDAELEMCLPYMRTRAESMSYEIIQNSPNGIIVLDNDYKIIEYNNCARTLLGIDDYNAKGKFGFDCFDTSDFVLAVSEGKNITKKRIKIDKSGKIAELTIVLVPEHKIIFGIMKDVTETVEYDKKLTEMQKETFDTTDEVIKKQMRVAQEIASLLGETTAETKVALLKLKKSLIDSSEEKE